MMWMSGSTASRPSPTLSVMASFVTAVVMALMASGCGGGLLVALNGFSEREAKPILGGYAVAAALATWLTSAFVAYAAAGASRRGRQSLLIGALSTVAALASVGLVAAVFLR